MFRERPKIEKTKRIANSYNKRTVMILYVYFCVCVCVCVCVCEREREREKERREGGRDDREM